MSRLTRAQLLAEVEALRDSLAKEAAQRRRLERKLARELSGGEHAGDDPAEAQAYDEAVGEILRLITSSPGEAQLVFEAIARHARTLCQAASSAVLSFDGEWIRLSAIDHMTPDGQEAVRRAFPVRPDRGTAAGHALLTREVVHIPDQHRDREYGLGDTARAVGSRSIACVPMLRLGEAVGCITVLRPEPGSFSDRQIAILGTFAEQAVVAIASRRRRSTCATSSTAACLRAWPSARRRCPRPIFRCSRARSARPPSTEGSSSSSTTRGQSRDARPSPRAAGLRGPHGGARRRGARDARPRCRRPRAPRRDDARSRRLGNLRAAQGRPGAPRRTRADDLLAGRGRERRPLHPAGRRRLPLQALQPIILRARVGASLEKKRLRDREIRHLAELAEWNRALEERVKERVAQVERLGRLRS